MGKNIQTMFVGDRFKNNSGTWAVVVKYKNSKNVSVKFEDSFEYEGVYSSTDIRKGAFRNPYDKNTYGVGYLGVGEEPTKVKGKDSSLANIWRAMLERCYANNGRPSIVSYIGCTVKEEWHNFQNFAKWARCQIGFNLKEKNLDKDILLKGNKIYGPDTCCFVPSRVNMMFVRASKVRGEYPVGVYFNKAKGKLQVRCNDENCKSVFLGRYDSVDYAFIVYKKYKESVIKKVADQYKDVIDPKVYQALLNYEVTVND